MQLPKKAHISFQSWVFVFKKFVNKILQPVWKYLRVTLREMLSYAGGTFFRIVYFLIQFAILCNVLSLLGSPDN